MNLEHRRDLLKHTTAHYPFYRLEDSSLERELDKALVNLKPDASPGYPYCKEFKTVSDVMDVLGVQTVKLMAWNRIRAIQAAPREAFTNWTPLECVEHNLCDPKRIFIKNEPHTTKKVAEGRYRLIVNFSLVDQLVERTFNSCLNNAEIEHYQELPSQPGMGLHDEGLEYLHSRMDVMGDPASTDVRGWDWNVKQWMLDLDSAHRAVNTGRYDISLYPLDLEDQMHWRIGRLTGFCVLVDSDGYVWEQLHREIVKSGSYITSSGNSRMRYVASLEVRRIHLERHGVWSGHDDHDAITMGDDCVEDLDYMSDVIHACRGAHLTALYASLGITIKEIQFFPVLEFCSYRFDMLNSVYPYSLVDRSKRLVNFLLRWPATPAQAVEKLSALAFELRHDPDGRHAVHKMQSLWAGEVELSQNATPATNTNSL